MEIKNVMWDSMLDGLGGFLTVGQTADMLNLSKKVVYDLIQEGMIGAIRIGKRGLRVRMDSVETFKNSKKGNSL